MLTIVVLHLSITAGLAGLVVLVIGVQSVAGLLRREEPLPEPAAPTEPARPTTRPVRVEARTAA